MISAEACVINLQTGFCKTRDGLTPDSLLLSRVWNQESVLAPTTSMRAINAPLRPLFASLLLVNRALSAWRARPYNL